MPPSAEEGDAGHDVPVNKITSFYGRLNQYLHESGTSSSLTNNVPGCSTPDLKRSISAVESHPVIPSATASVSASPKRRRAVAKTPTPSPSKSSISSPRLTRSRSSSSIPISPPSTTTSRKQTPSKRNRAPRIETPPIHSSPPSLLRDSIPPNLILLLVGVNPGLLTGVTGHAYAHPSNLFWKLLQSSGITSIRHPPSDTYKLPELYSVGNTNIVERPTRDASMLSRAEMDAGVPVLEAKVAMQRPEAVCLVGKGIWEAVWRVRHGRSIRKEEFRYGWQDISENMGCVSASDWSGAPVFVATTTSGLAAGMRPAEKEAIWAELGSWVARRRVERTLSSAAVAAVV